MNLRLSLNNIRWISVAHVIAESSWMFGIMLMIGVAFGKTIPSQQPIITWFGVLLLMSLGSYLGHYDFFGLKMRFRSLTTLLVIYFVVALTPAPGHSFEIFWPNLIFSDASTAGYKFRLILSIFLSSLLWLRGTRIGAFSSPDQGMSTTFKIGVLILSLTIVVDLFSVTNLNTFILSIIFFASGLFGLGFANIDVNDYEDQSNDNNINPVTLTVGALVVIISTIGVFSTFLQGDIANYISLFMFFFYQMFVFAFIWGFVVPIAWIYGLIVDLIRKLFMGMDSSAEAREAPPMNFSEGAIESIQNIQREGGVNPIFSIVLWTLFTLILIFILYLSMKYLMRPKDKKTIQLTGQRESLIEDANVLEDFKNLFSSLFQGIGRRSKKSLYDTGEGSKGIIEIILLYYKFLEFAETKGVSKKPHQTTLEFRNSLQSIFNQNFVKEITDSFNDAFYGAKSFDIDTILKLENQFDQIRFGKTK
jgi:hypothetical protein|tara:strand:- start:18080 stop:19507 length:1428 start_codon:yes stop_codon:yes gene_type:complete